MTKFVEGKLCYVVIAYIRGTVAFIFHCICDSFLEVIYLKVV